MKKTNLEKCFSRLTAAGFAPEYVTVVNGGIEKRMIRCRHDYDSICPDDETRAIYMAIAKIARACGLVSDLRGFATASYIG